MITAIEVSAIGAVPANDITIELRDGSTVVWREVIGSGAPRGERTGVSLSYPIEMTEGNAVSLVVSGGGAGVITVANIAGFTR